MSDDDYNGGWGANAGTTLPEGNQAIYNIMLSPFFMPRSGRVGGINDTSGANVILDNGGWGRLWSDTISNNDSAYNLAFARGIWPSAKDARTHAFSLRCLVSTNNG